jgi:hypothetical protein
MEAVATAGDDGGAGARPEAGPAAGPSARPDARRSARIRMFRAAQIAFRSTVLDCTLLDASPEGVRVFFRAPADVPDLVTLRLPGGETRPVRCRWQAGLLAGFEVVGAAPLAVPAA